MTRRSSTPRSGGSPSSRRLGLGFGFGFGFGLGLANPNPNPNLNPSPNANADPNPHQEADLSRAIALLDQVDAISSTNPYIYDDRAKARMLLGALTACCSEP